MIARKVVVATVIYLAGRCAYRGGGVASATPAAQQAAAQTSCGKPRSFPCSGRLESWSANIQLSKSRSADIQQERLRSGHDPRLPCVCMGNTPAPQERTHRRRAREASAEAAALEQRLEDARVAIIGFQVDVEREQTAQQELEVSSIL